MLNVNGLTLTQNWVTLLINTLAEKCKFRTDNGIHNSNKFTSKTKGWTIGQSKEPPEG